MSDTNDALAPPQDAMSPGAPPAPPNNADIQPLLNQARGNLAASQQRTAPLLQQRQKALDDLGGATQQYQQAAQNAPKPPQQQAPPTNGIDFNNASMWLMGATVLGAIAGSLTRRHVTNSMAAFTGALQGLKEGNQLKFEQQTKVWEEQNKLAAQQYQYARDAYNDILNNKKFDITTKSYMVEQLALQIKDEQMQQAAATRDIVTMTGLMEARQREYDKSRQAFIGTMRQMEQMKETKRHHLAQEGEPLTPEARRMVGDQLKAGDTSGLTGLGRGAQGQKEVAGIRNTLAAEGTKGEDLAKAKAAFGGEQSYQKTTGSMAGRVETATDELENAVPLALQASNDFPRGHFVPVNQIKIMIAKGTSNEKYNEFLLRNNAVAKAYGRAINPQGVPRVSEMAEAKAEGILSMATSPQAYQAQLRSLMLEASSSKRAVTKARGGVSEPAAPPPAPIKVRTPDEASKLPAGTHYVTPDGQEFTR